MGTNFAFTLLLSLNHEIERDIVDEADKIATVLRGQIHPNVALREERMARMRTVKKILETGDWLTAEASTPERAFMESVLHDIPLASPGHFEVDRLKHFHLAPLKLRADIKGFDFEYRNKPLTVRSLIRLVVDRRARRLPSPGRGSR